MRIITGVTRDVMEVTEPPDWCPLKQKESR